MCAAWSPEESPEAVRSGPARYTLFPLTPVPVRMLACPLMCCCAALRFLAVRDEPANGDALLLRGRDEFLGMMHLFGKLMYAKRT